MKKLIFLLLLCPLAIGLKAQRVDLDRAWFAYNYRNIPSIVVDNSYTTYSVSVTKSPALKVFSNETNTSNISIEGKKKVESGGHILINVELNDLIIETSEVKERIDIRKDKDGKETGRSYYYRVEAVYTFDANATVKDYTGKSLASWVLSSGRDKKTYTSSEYSKSSEAANFYNNNKVEIKTNLVKEQIDAALTSLNSSLRSGIAYATSSSRENLWDLGSKKNAEFAAYTQATATIIEALKMITANEIPKEVFEKVQPAIDYFTSLPSKYTSDEKGDKKLRYGAYYNLGIFYLFTEQFDKAKEAGKNLINNDYDVKDGEEIIKRANSVMDQLQKHQLTSRHFVIDISNAQPPQ
jgi:hypothetical protein